MEASRLHRVQHISNMVVARYLRHPKQRLAVRATVAAPVLSSMATTRASGRCHRSQFRVRIWESLTGSWRKTYELTKDSTTMDLTVKASAGRGRRRFRQGPEIPSYLYGFWTGLLERAPPSDPEERICPMRVWLRTRQTLRSLPSFRTTIASAYWCRGAVRTCGTPRYTGTRCASPRSANAIGGFASNGLI
jgi:hypothetical protein